MVAFVFSFNRDIMLKETMILNRFWTKTLVILGILIGLPTPLTQASLNCSDCESYYFKLKEQEKNKTITQDILNKNQAYLAKLGSSDASKKIKVNSNILMLL